MVSSNTKSCFIIFFILLISCASIGPVTKVSQFPVGKKSNLINIISIVLPEYGYAISVVNKETGTITTDWKQKKSKFLIWNTGLARTRISVSVSPDKNDFTLKMFKQEWDDNDKIWKDTNPSGDDKKRLDTILNDVKMKIGM